MPLTIWTLEYFFSYYLNVHTVAFVAPDPDEFAQYQGSVLDIFQPSRLGWAVDAACGSIGFVSELKVPEQDIVLLWLQQTTAAVSRF